MDRLRALRRNPRVLLFATAFMEFKIMNAVITLFYLHRGVTIDRIFWLSIVWSLTSLFFEVPTGYLADRFGRKHTLILGTFFLIGANVVSFFAHGFWQFGVVFVLMSLGFACFSGTKEALLYDTLLETKSEKDMTMHNGRMSAAGQFFNILLPIIGVLIAKDLLEWQFTLLISIEIVGTAVTLGFLSMLCEPKHARNVAEQERGIFRQSLDTIRQRPVLLRFALNKLLVFIASFLFWRVYQSYMISHGIPTLWLGVYYFLINVTLFVLYWKLDVLEKRFGFVRFLFGSAAGGMLFLLLVPLVRTPVVLFICAFFAIVLLGVREPIFADMVNKHIHSGSRATTLSNLSMLKGILDIPILFLTGWLAAKDPRFVFCIGASLCLVVLVFFPVRHQDVAEKKEGVSAA